MNLAPTIFDLNYQELETSLVDLGEARYRARQIWEGIYKNLWGAPEEFTPLPSPLRTVLATKYLPFSHLQPAEILKSTDQETTKTLFRLPDGQAIEAILMRYNRRRTLCISTQAGCAMGCVFCATGQMGFRRHLSSGEIIEQVLYYARILAQKMEKVTNIVIMGMGEPFHNYEATMAAIDRLNHPWGFNFSERRITVSTVGIVPGIQKFTAERRQVNLAISLHAADDELRSSILPINKRYPLDELFAACRDYASVTRRRITFEWALIDEVNDSPQQAQRLAERLRGLLCHVNIIPLNPTQQYNGRAAPRKRVLEFQAELEKKGIPCTIRLRRGIDIQAGCGQLAIKG